MCETGLIKKVVKLNLCFIQPDSFHEPGTRTQPWPKSPGSVFLVLSFIPF